MKVSDRLDGSMLMGLLGLGQVIFSSSMLKFWLRPSGLMTLPPNSVESQLWSQTLCILYSKYSLPFYYICHQLKVHSNTMNSQFGEMIRTLREKQNLYLRQVAPLLEMDTAQLSKIEKGIRQLKREQVPIIAGALKASSDELMTLWLADQIYAVVKDEKLANEAMQVAEQKINLSKRRKK